MNGIDILVVISVVLLVLLVIFLRFILPKIKTHNVNKKRKIENDSKRS